MGYIDSESLVKKASFLRIQARSLAENMKSGNFRSLYRGQGIEFSGVRDYIRGDDIRSIDWNVTARMGRPYVKLFEEERELQIFIVMDTSASMLLDCGSRLPTKYAAGANTAALITLAAEMNGCPVGAVFFDGRIHFSCKPQSGKERTMLLLTHLDKLPQKQTNGSVLANALIGADKILRKRSLVFVLSDFRSAEWETPLIKLAQKNDITFPNIITTTGGQAKDEAYFEKKRAALASLGLELVVGTCVDAELEGDAKVAWSENI